MNNRLVSFTMTIGSTLGGCIPIWFGVNAFSGYSILGILVGGAVGIWVGVQLSN